MTIDIERDFTAMNADGVTSVDRCGYTLKLIANAAGQSATDHASVTVTVPPVHKPKPIAPPPEQEPAEG